jgi:hypothetical protein
MMIGGRAICPAPAPAQATDAVAIEAMAKIKRRDFMVKLLTKATGENISQSVRLISAPEVPKSNIEAMKSSEMRTFRPLGRPTIQCSPMVFVDLHVPAA